MHGYLHKRSDGKAHGSVGNALAKWNLRYFALSSDAATLLWYRDQKHHSSGAEAAGSIPVRGCSVKRLPPDPTAALVSANLQIFSS